MLSPEIIENQAIGSLARTARYFVRVRNYGYIDNIRNARRDSRDFEEAIAKMLREAEVKRVQEEQIHLPTEDDVKKVFRLANEHFEDVKLSLAILSFSFQTRREGGT